MNQLMRASKTLILWLAFVIACSLSASALTPIPPENCIWEIFSTGYDAPATEATDLGSPTETSTSNYDTAPIRGEITEEISTEANRSLFGQIAEFKAAEGGGVLANQAAGQSAEALAKAELEAQGNTIIGSQVTARTSGGIRYIDHLVQTPDGDIFAVEVKSGGAVRNASQLMKDDLMYNEGATLGNNAGVLEGQTLKIDTVEMHY